MMVDDVRPTAGTIDSKTTGVDGGKGSGEGPIQEAPQGDRKGRSRRAVGHQSYIYFAETENGQYVKIGCSSRPYKRVCQLGALMPGNHALRLIGWMPGSSGTEAWLHAKFAADRDKGEWFRSSEALRLYIAGLGLNAPDPDPIQFAAPVKSGEKSSIQKAAAEMGRKGGRKKVPKGFALVTDEERRRIQSLGGKARWLRSVAAQNGNPA